MSLNFPTSPSNGDTYQQYVYDATNGVWQLDRPSSDKTPVTAVVSGASVTPSYDGTAAVYSFTSSGNIIIESAGYADLLLVGGGGGGGYGYAGGGGGGGFLYIQNAYLPAGSLDVVVGAGGAAGVPTSSEGAPGNNGQISRIADFYSPGGGGGASASITGSGTAPGLPGFNGASGGGAGGYTTSAFVPSGGLALAPLGNAGGDSSTTAGGGGGGAGAAGSNATSNNGGNGGNGSASSITGSSVTYAGGGGGGGGASAGTGGSGGGGAGSTGGSATGGSANTGGGGGGTSTGTSAAGGSGIVIVRINS